MMLLDFQVLLSLFDFLGYHVGTSSGCIFPITKGWWEPEVATQEGLLADLAALVLSGLPGEEEWQKDVVWTWDQGPRRVATKRQRSSFTRAPPQKGTELSESPALSNHKSHKPEFRSRRQRHAERLLGWHS